jgi:valyl-tRNA synthetase
MSDLQDRTRFDPAEVEPRVLERWLAAHLVHPEPLGSAAENYSIAIPPPNVTGALHMGHALNGTIQDVLVRANRMRGRRTKWILGTDHAGIATQRQVEKLLQARGSSREELGRAAFVERVWEWREQYGAEIIEQFKRLGATADYEDERFTMDAGYVKAVGKVFVELYEQGLIYRDHYMVNWDPGLRSAISDLEVEEREGIVDTLYSIAYPLACGDGELVVATVRPETMLADTAIAVHPGDERYSRLIGRQAILPLVGRRLEIIADEYVRTDFGTGALKVTPGHDPNDFEIGRRHGLREIGVIGEDGLMNAAAGERYAGLTVEQARERIVGDLEREGAIRGTEEYVHTVPYSHRSGARVEPLISLQWFMRMDELAAPAIEAVRDGRVRIHPQSQSRRYVDWLSEIRPWCISRQLWWGHQIPVWYRGGETYVGTEPPEGDGWEQDPDVLDTWFSSALWPFATLGWPDDTPALRAFYPTDVLSTARDILFLWVTRMVMMGLRFAGDVPFTDVYVHSVIQAPDGRRMSKSLGTGIDPLREIEAHGADAVRFGLLAMSSTQDVRYSAEKVQQGQALANKLYNATRFVALRVQTDPARPVDPAPRPRTVEDRWILSRLQVIKDQTRCSIDGFDFAKAALGLYDFIYGELCDWYLELVKPRLGDHVPGSSTSPDPAARADLGATLMHVLQETLAIAHPVIPFVTEELWALLGNQSLLASSRMPEPDRSLRDARAETQMQRAIEAVRALRTWRESVGVKPGMVVPALLDGAGYEATAGQIAWLGRLELMDGRSRDGADPHTAAPIAPDAIANVAIPGGTVRVLESDAVDLGAAERRLAEQRERLGKEIARAQGKLANESFVARAPTAVVDAERRKLTALQSELTALRAPAPECR